MKYYYTLLLIYFFTAQSTIEVEWHSGVGRFTACYNNATYTIYDLLEYPYSLFNTVIKIHDPKYLFDEKKIVPALQTLYARHEYSDWDVRPLEIALLQSISSSHETNPHDKNCYPESLVTLSYGVLKKYLNQLNYQDELKQQQYYLSRLPTDLHYLFTSKHLLSLHDKLYPLTITRPSSAKNWQNRNSNQENMILTIFTGASTREYVYEYVIRFLKYLYSPLVIQNGMKFIALNLLRENIKTLLEKGKIKPQLIAEQPSSKNL